MIEFVGVLVLLLTAGFGMGYAFRGFIGKELKKLGEELRAELVKAHLDAAKEAAAVEAKLKLEEQSLKTDMAKVVEEVKSKL